MNNAIAHGIVSRIMLLPARVPMPMFSCSWADGPLAPITEIIITVASGSAPSTGSNKPPTKEGGNRFASSILSEPAWIKLAAYIKMPAYTKRRNAFPDKVEEHGKVSAKHAAGSKSPVPFVWL